jgi:hypothetical protein
MSTAGVVENDGQFAQESPDVRLGKCVFRKTVPPVELASAANTLVLASECSRFGISRASFFASFLAGVEIVGSLNIFMDLNSLFTNGDIGRMRVNPGSAIEIVDSVLVLVHGGMGVAAENARCVMVAGMSQGAFGDLWR